jgi:predicted RND superfamily exporter protein
VLFSALTTIMSFGTLAFSSHVGLAGLGRLLTLGMALMVASNLVVLPALLAWRARAAAPAASSLARPTPLRHP